VPKTRNWLTETATRRLSSPDDEAALASTTDIAPDSEAQERADAPGQQQDSWRPAAEADLEPGDPSSKP
jgi:hypothetical protein